MVLSGGLGGLFIYAQSPRHLIATLACPDRVNDVAFSGDRRFLAAAYGWSEGGGISVWNTADLTLVASWSSPTGNAMRSVTFSPNGEMLAAADWDGSVFLWVLGDWAKPRKVISSRGSPTGLAFSPASDILAFSSKKGLTIYDLSSKTALEFNPPVGPSRDFIEAGFNTDGELLACRDGVLESWHARTGRKEKLRDLDGPLFVCGLSPRATFVVTGGGSVYGKKLVQIWRFESDTPIAQLTAFRSGVFASAVSHSEDLLVLAGGDYGSGGDLSIWSLPEVRELGFVSTGKFPIKAVAFSPDDVWLAAGSGDGAVFLYDVNAFHGPQQVTQSSWLCGEVRVEDNRTDMIALSKVPMSIHFDLPWTLPIANPDSMKTLAGYPVAVQKWVIESDSATDKARVSEFKRLLSEDKAPSNYIVFGETQNPGWDEGYVAKIYANGLFVASDPSGKCLAIGSLATVAATDFESLKQRLLAGGFLDIPREPLTRGLSHYRTRFIGIATDGILEVRSDGEVVDFVRRHPTQKERQFRHLYEKEEGFINSIRTAGISLPD